MKVVWCWRCKMDIPMLDDTEWQAVWGAHSAERNPERDGRTAALAEYERITGFKETNFNALFHHRISLYGPPCNHCGRVLRTPVAYKCFECGLQLHEPGWSHLFCLEVDAFEVTGQGIVVIADEDVIAGRLVPGSEAEFRDGTRKVSRATLISVERFVGVSPQNKKVGLLFVTNVPAARIKQGQHAWLVSAPESRR